MKPVADRQALIQSARDHCLRIVQGPDCGHLLGAGVFARRLYVLIRDELSKLISADKALAEDPAASGMVEEMLAHSIMVNAHQEFDTQSLIKDLGASVQPCLAAIHTRRVLEDNDLRRQANYEAMQIRARSPVTVGFPVVEAGEPGLLRNKSCILVGDGAAVAWALKSAVDAALAAGHRVLYLSLSNRDVKMDASEVTERGLLQLGRAAWSTLQQPRKKTLAAMGALLSRLPEPADLIVVEGLLRLSEKLDMPTIELNRANQVMLAAAKMTNAAVLAGWPVDVPPDLQAESLETLRAHATLRPIMLDKEPGGAVKIQLARLHSWEVPGADWSAFREDRIGLLTPKGIR